ncbi:hypothetical protein C8J57DRAFT_1736746 [Mycena rebaudengoi]|nr:hypothetical protein C8J57DRAFT_1736746 [Mycena rebaudengoi]
MELSGVVLPVELERTVFEAAAVVDYKNIARLLLVARRVHTWLKLFLSHVLVYRGLNMRAPLFGTHARHLMLDLSRCALIIDIAPILAVCSAVLNLACYYGVDPSCLPPLALMRPLRLCVYAVDLFARRPPRFAHPLFARTTHLQLLDLNLSAFDAASWASLRSLPSLTHLALMVYAVVPARALHKLLRESAGLRALVVICRADADAADWRAKFPTRDVRFVVTVVGDVVGDWETTERAHTALGTTLASTTPTPAAPRLAPACGTRPAGHRQRARHRALRATDPNKYVVPDASPPAHPTRRVHQRPALAVSSAAGCAWLTHPRPHSLHAYHHCSLRPRVD